MLTAAARTLLVYVFITLFMRLSGKRQVGQLQVGELVSALLISELAALPVTDPDIPAAFALLPILLITLFEIVSSCLCALFPKIKKIVEGTPSLLVDGGKLNEEQLFKARLSPDELLAQLRLKGVSDPEQVDYAILEQNGQLSVIVKEEYQPASPKDLGLAPQKTGLALPLIVCGAVNSSNLKKKGISKQKLARRISPHRIKDVLIYTVNDAGEARMVLRNKRL